MQPRRKLNLFVFSSETNALFNLLMLASVMLALFLGNALGIFFNLGNSLASVKITSFGVDTALAFLPIVCLSGFSLFPMLGVAFFLYYRHPAQIRKRRKILPLNKKDALLFNEVNKLAIQADVKTPLIEIARGLKGTDAQAFGIGAPHSLALDGGLRILRKTNPSLFKALTHHELAHVANEDVGRSYFSNALWDSIRWTLLPLFAIAIGWPVLDGFISSAISGILIDYFLRAVPTALLVFQFIATFAFAGMIWARLLRTREYHADWRAAHWGSEDGLRKILQENAEKEKPASPLNFWTHHPSAKERIAALNQPIRLFSLSWGLIFFAGLLLAFTLSGVQIEISGFMVFSGFVIEARNASSGLLYWLARAIWFGGFLFTILIVFAPISWLLNGTILPQIQKQAVLDLADNQHGFAPYLKLVFPAFLLMGGLEIGFILTPFDSLFPNALVGIVMEIFLIAPLLGCVIWGYFSFIRFFALRLAANQTGQTYSIWRTRFLQTVSSIWAFLFFAPGLLLSRFLDFVWPAALGWLILTILISPIFFITTWGIAKILFDKQPKKCPHCGKITSQAFPVLKECEHCQNPLGEWLFIPTK